MHAINKILVPTVALLAMVQYCPAPFLAAPLAVGIAGAVSAAAGVAGAIEGGISAAHSKRDIDSKPRQFNSRIKGRQNVSNLGLGTAWSDCTSELKDTTITFSSTSSTTVLVSGIPPACMTLCGVFTDIYEEGHPVPMSSDSISFTNLTPADLQEIQDALDAHPNYKKD